MSLFPVQGEEPEKEAVPAAPVKKQPAPVQENTAAVQPVKAAAAEVSVESSMTLHICRALKLIFNVRFLA